MFVEEHIAKTANLFWVRTLCTPPQIQPAVCVCSSELLHVRMCLYGVSAPLPVQATITERDDQIARLRKDVDELRKKLKAHEDEKNIMKRQQDVS